MVCSVSVNHDGVSELPVMPCHADMSHRHFGFKRHMSHWCACTRSRLFGSFRDQRCVTLILQVLWV